MTEKLILVVLDGVNAATGFPHLGYCEHRIEQGDGAKYTCRAELPAMSRPLYETLQTGLPAAEHGIETNFVSRRSHCDNLFRMAKAAGRSTAAAAYHWVCELYDKHPFIPAVDRFRFDKKDETSWVDHGIYYFTDSYPVEYTFLDAQMLIDRYQPDYVLVHPMNADHAGHLHGAESAEYAQAVLAADLCIADRFAAWRNAGYDVIVTADHGMNRFGFHNGSSDADRLVPLFIFSDRVRAGDFSDTVVSQLLLAPLCARLMGVPLSPAMRKEEIF